MQAPAIVHGFEKFSGGLPQLIKIAIAATSSCFGVFMNNSALALS